MRRGRRPRQPRGRGGGPARPVSRSSGASLGRPPPGSEVMLQRQGRGEGIHVALAAFGGAAHLAYGGERARRAKPLVPELDRLPGGRGDGAGKRGGRAGGVALDLRGVEREADDNAGHGMAVQQGEELAHGKALPGAAGEGRQGLGERLRLVGQGETDATLTPVDPEQPSRHPCAIVAKNSVLVLVRLSRSSRNSIASTGGMSARKLRSRYTLLSSSLFKSSSSLRVLERCTSIAGNVRRSAIRRSRPASTFPRPFNSSNIPSP